jgi:hypothetical protein
VRRQPHVYVQGPILLSDLPHVFDSHGESSGGHQSPRPVVGCGYKKALSPGYGRRPRRDNRGGRRKDGTLALPAREVAFSRDAPTRQVDRMMLTHAHIDQIAERLPRIPPAPATPASRKQRLFVRPHVSDGYPENVLPRRSYRVFEEIVACRGNGLWSAHENQIKTMDRTAVASRPLAMVAHAWSSTAAQKSCAQAATFVDSCRILNRQAGRRGWYPRSSTSPERSAAVAGRPSAMFHDHPLTPEV